MKKTLNEYERQKQKEFDILYLKELDLIDNEIIKTLITIINSITDLDDFTTNLFNHDESYNFKVKDRKICIDYDGDMCIIDISNDNFSECDAFHIYDSGFIDYEHHDLNKEVYWNDDIGNFDTNEEKLNYFKEKINFIDWIKANGTELIQLIIQAVEYNETKSPILEDIRTLNKLAKSYN